MTGRFRRTPLWTQFTVLLVLVALTGGFMAFVLMGRAYITNAQSRARTVADFVEDVGAWASKYKGMWVRSEADDDGQVGDFLETVQIARMEHGQADAKVALHKDGSFHRKIPSLVQRELSEVTNATNHPVRFRMTSDKFMNPGNAPTRFELAAIERMRQTGETEATEINGNRLQYARRLTAETACMSCHDSPDKAPAAVRARYPEANMGYGYKLGGVAGVISVSVPIVEGGGTLFHALGPVAWFSIGGFVASLACMLWFIRRAIIAPLRRLSTYASRASEADIAEIKGASLRFTAAEETSRNEVHRLSVAVKRMLRSLKVQRRY